MRRSTLAALTAGLVALAAGTACGGGTRDADESDTTDSATETTAAVETTLSPTTAAPATTASSSSSAPATTATTAVATTLPSSTAATTPAPANGELLACLQGEWALANIALNDPTGDYALEGAIQGVVLTFAPGSWTWNATEGKAAGSWQGVPVEVTVNGTAGGALIVGAGQVQMALDTSDGEAELNAGGLSDTVPLEDALVALSPSGTATATCGPTEAELVTTTNTMTLTRSAPPATSAAPAPPAAGDPIVIDTTAADRTEACAGRPVVITGSTSPITLTGDCPEVSVTGAANEVHIERAGVITVTGSFNEVTWSAAIDGTTPTVNDTGVNNQIAEG